MFWLVPRLDLFTMNTLKWMLTFRNFLFVLNLKKTHAKNIIF